MPHIAQTLQKLVGDRKTSLLRHSLSWHGHFWPMRHPLDSMGTDGGGGEAEDDLAAHTTACARRFFGLSEIAEQG